VRLLREIRPCIGGAPSSRRRRPRKSSTAASGTGSGGVASAGRPSKRPTAGGSCGSRPSLVSLVSGKSRAGSPMPYGPIVSKASPSSIHGRRGGGLGGTRAVRVPPVAISHASDGEAEGDHPLLVDSREIARLLCIGRTKAFQLIARGEVPVVRIGRCVRVPRSALESWIAARTVEAKPTEQASSRY
jgi:excisionase family DNA binding protein